MALFIHHSCGMRKKKKKCQGFSHEVMGTCIWVRMIP